MLFGKASFGAETGERLVNQPVGDRWIASQLASQVVIAPSQGSRVPTQKNASGDSRFDPTVITKHKRLKEAS